jgi:hypothetical protein
VFVGGWRLWDLIEVLGWTDCECCVARWREMGETHFIV